MTIDRGKRGELAKTIREYLSDGMMAFRFDEEIQRIAAETVDPTVWFVVDELWFFYDDCKDHPVVLSEPAWNYVQRLLLLLESDGRVEVETREIWCAPQVFAAAGLIGLGLLFWWLGAVAYVFLAIPLGGLVAGLWIWRRRLLPPMSDLEEALMPFSSLRELRAVYRAVPGFEKRRYPLPLARRQIRGPFPDVLLSMWLVIPICLGSPVILLFQARPLRTQATRVCLVAP